jgi:hypothetical protein
MPVREQFSSEEAFHKALRDYFMAHAPVEPQPWFEPVMPPCPEMPEPLADLTADERNELDGWSENMLRAQDMIWPRSRQWATAADAAHKAGHQWRIERAKQRSIQWPAAWADAMLAERARTS